MKTTKKQKDIERYNIKEMFIIEEKIPLWNICKCLANIVYYILIQKEKGFEMSTLKISELFTFWHDIEAMNYSHPITI